MKFTHVYIKPKVHNPIWPTETILEDSLKLQLYNGLCDLCVVLYEQ